MRPALFYIIIITAFETTITFLVIVCKLAGFFFYVWIFRWVIVKGDRDQDLSFDLDQTFANLFASILCTFQYCLLFSKTCHSHKSNFPMFYNHDFLKKWNLMYMSNLIISWRRPCCRCLQNRDLWCYGHGNNNSHGRNCMERNWFKIFKEMVCVITYL